MESVRAIEWSWKGPVDGDEHLLMNFLEAPAFAGLDTLWLDGAKTSEGTVKSRSGRFLAQLAKVNRLPCQHFHVAGLMGDIHTIRTLRSWEGFSKLLSLRLVDAHGGSRWPRLLSTIPTDNQIRFLDLGGSDLGDAGLKALLECPLPMLERLVLRAAKLTDAGVQALLDWAALDGLTLLDVSDNAVSDERVAQLSERLGDRLRWSA
jgi:hypothetical protein